MSAPEKMTISQWLAVGDILNEMKLKRTTKRRRDELQASLSTWDAAARERGLEDAAAWRALGWKADEKAKQIGARWSATNGITQEMWAQMLPPKSA